MQRLSLLPKRKNMAATSTYGYSDENAILDCDELEDEAVVVLPDRAS